MWAAPIIIGVGVWELYRQVGYSSIIGLVVMMVFLPIAGGQSRMHRHNHNQPQATDTCYALTVTDVTCPVCCCCVQL